jgi:MarR family transcriptional repressor of emrRAB
MKNPEASDSFTPIEQRLARRRKRLDRLPYQRIVVVRLLNHLSKRLQETLQAGLSAHQLSLPAYEVLLALYDDEQQTLSASELARTTGEKRANLTRLCDLLVERGWIERLPHPDDRRGVQLRLTPAGRVHIESAQPAMWATIDELFKRFPGSALGTLQRLLRELLRRTESLRTGREDDA